jgi:phage-related protein
MAAPPLRELRFLGRAREDLRSFPPSAREAAGRQLLLLQQGGEPADWKPMKSVGSGVSELRIHDQSGAFRVIYIAKLKDAVYVLHCFEKKSQKTSLADLRLATARFKELSRGGPRH